jgi:hypothetical protein
MRKSQLGIPDLRRCQSEKIACRICRKVEIFHKNPIEILKSLVFFNFNKISVNYDKSTAWFCGAGSFLDGLYALDRLPLCRLPDSLRAEPQML